LASPKNNLFQVQEEFLKENVEYAKTKRQRKNGGPYSKGDKNKRQDEVYRLHFEYGYSARKIAELMNINRNTINRDVDYWYYKACKNFNYMDPENRIIMTLQRMGIQMSRLREQLDKVKTNSERMAIERLIFDINSKILHTHQKLGESYIRISKIGVEYVNDLFKKMRRDERLLTLFDTKSVSEKAYEKIQKIIEENKLYG